MGILFTGNLSPMASGFFRKIDQNHKIVVCGKSGIKDFGNLSVTPYDYNIDEAEFKNIFKTYSFKTVIYISNTIDGAIKAFDELENLENTLYLCRQNKVTNFIYITDNDFEEGTHENNSNSSRFILQQACESLCRNSSKEYGINLTLVRVPYIYNTEMNVKPHLFSQLGIWVNAAVLEKKIAFPGNPDDEVDFLWDEDLGILLDRILDDPPKGYLEMNIAGRNGMTYHQLSEMIRSHVADIEVSYIHKRIAIPQCAKGPEARQKYGWFPVGSLDEQLPGMIASCRSQYKKRKSFLFGANTKVKDVLSVSIELISFFALTTYLDYWTADNAQIGFLDFRLIFVVVMGVLRGLDIGMLAAAAACIGYVFSATVELQWQIVFYNVQNWLPFAAYFLAGSVSGYTSDKSNDAIRFLKQEQEVLEQKYIFLSELYMKALENKDAFNSQIIGYKNSYGRIYEVTKKLESTIPEQIFYEAVQVLEDVLENCYVAIYSIKEDSDYARLNVCSKSLHTVLQKSVRISDYPEMMDRLNADKTWINTKCLPDYPAYAIAITHNKKIAGLICLQYAEDRQMNLDFSNRFKIVSGLIKNSLIRAIERREQAECGTMIPNTRILKKEHFQQVLEVKRHMKEKEISEYLLIRLFNTGRKLTELSDTVSKMVRDNDIIGVGEDEQVYLILSQTNSGYLSVIAERLLKNQIQFELVHS